MSPVVLQLIACSRGRLVTKLTRIASCRQTASNTDPLAGLGLLCVHQRIIQKAILIFHDLPPIVVVRNQCPFNAGRKIPSFVRPAFPAQMIRVPTILLVLCVGDQFSALTAAAKSASVTRSFTFALTFPSYSVEYVS